MDRARTAKRYDNQTGGVAATLADVVTHYNQVRKLNLSAEQQRDLIEYLKSL